ncbi:MAG TPA: helix-turn-helix domain-containing protein [Planctomycetota bacterium]|nr:helix-turn-helix domain-containing protein [Planctomycetota bacterium]
MPKTTSDPQAASQRAPALISAREAAQALGLPESTVKHWLVRGYIRGWRPGPRMSWRITPAEVERMRAVIAAGVARPATPSVTQ